MALAPHTRLGPYEVIELLGSGGMGEVYRAHDARLGRDVAIKVLRSDATATEEQRQRQEREARTISKLSHPHIGPLFDVGRAPGADGSGDMQYLVMELLEGQTLASRLERGGRMPMDAVLRVGAEIASALAAAHARGIVHRDLKPGNVMLTPTGARLMDFGLARALDRPDDGTAGDGDQTTLTAVGVAVGTVPYMAPEQIHGKADAKSDIFALGAVLFEMATGVRAFSGSTQASTLTAVLTHEPPPVSTLEPSSSPAFDRIVRRCLTKDPAGRWSSAADLEIQLRELLSPSGATMLPPGAPAAKPAATAPLPWIVASAAVLVAILTLALATRHPETATTGAAPARFQVWPAAGSSFQFHVDDDYLAVSPDGRRIAFIAEDTLGRKGVWTRALDHLGSRAVDGTNGARTVFWSPDGRSIGFVANGRVQRVSIDGGRPTPICEMAGPFGAHASWGSAGNILFSYSGGPSIYRVPAEGGKPVEVVTADTSRGEFVSAAPVYLPDGKRFLYNLIRSDGTGSIMYVAPGAKPRELMKAVSRADFAEPDRLLYVEEGTLYTRSFDWKQGRVSGAAIPVADTVGYFLSNGGAAFATSPSGTLVFQSGSTVSELRWLDRTGQDVGGASTPGNYFDVRISPDGGRLLYSRVLPMIGTLDVWLYDVSRGTETRLTPSINSDFAGMWLAGGREVLYSARVSKMPQLVRRDLDTGDSRPLTAPTGFQVAFDLSPDGRILLYWESRASGESSVWRRPLEGGEPARLFPPGGAEQSALFSPDGRFTAFTSTETGSPELYVTAFPGPAQRVRVSNHGVSVYRWPRESNEILYLDDQRRMISVPVRTSPTLELGAPKVLFTVKSDWSGFDVTADGRRFLAIVVRSYSGEYPLTVVTDWPHSLRQ